MVPGAMKKPRIYSKLEEHQVSAVVPVVRKWIRLAPSWCHSLRLEYSPDLKDADAACTPDSQYRRAVIEFAAAFFSGTEKEQERLIVHELLHLALAPLTEFVDDALERLTEGDEDFLAWVSDQWEERVDGVVEDIRELVFPEEDE